MSMILLLVSLNELKKIFPGMVTKKNILSKTKAMTSA